MLRPSLWFVLSLALGGVASAEPSPNPDVPVVDLRVGLSRSLSQPGSLALGVGQGGFVALEKGHVIGALLPLPAPNSASVTLDADTAYLELRQALQFSDRFAIGRCQPDSTRIAIWFELEDSGALAQAPSSVGLWVTRGVRVFGLVGRRDNALATAASAFEPGPVTGLTATGRDIVRRVLAAGALVDVSNASDPAFDEVVALSLAARLPVLATHANARAIADKPWNLSDSQIRAVARTGGIVGVTAAHGHLSPGRSATLEHLVRQILYLVGVAGAEHVALGTGFEADAGVVKDFQSAADLPRLSRALRHAGLSERDVGAVMYRNALRVLCPAHV